MQETKRGSDTGERGGGVPWTGCQSKANTERQTIIPAYILNYSLFTLASSPSIHFFVSK